MTCDPPGACEPLFWGIGRVPAKLHSAARFDPSNRPLLARHKSLDLRSGESNSSRLSCCQRSAPTCSALHGDTLGQVAAELPEPLDGHITPCDSLLLPRRLLSMSLSRLGNSNPAYRYRACEQRSPKSHNDLLKSSPRCSSQFAEALTEAIQRAQRHTMSISIS